MSDIKISPIEIDFRRCFFLWHRAGRNPAPMFKIVQVDGGMKEVIEKCRIHCTNVNARFIRVDPFLSDMKNDELNHQRLEDL